MYKCTILYCTQCTVLYFADAEVPLEERGGADARDASAAEGAPPDGAARGRPVHEAHAHCAPSERHRALALPAHAGRADLYASTLDSRIRRPSSILVLYSAVFGTWVIDTFAIGSPVWSLWCAVGEVSKRARALREQVLAETQYGPERALTLLILTAQFELKLKEVWFIGSSLRSLLVVIRRPWLINTCNQTIKYEYEYL